ncbi:hypothetical protein [Halarcobacter bivalviorum]|uniref:Membrane protein n=1 Tax=Halarcobacter bivalviorum TaxID=663364 RepID=A0AAX2A9P8_9BACT|nr:hypothetical protein [Halarcobacter bivalviorum]AXH11402.1 putative membrane protein [Halarcobacter bivalviorum]RXK09411.1 hypothetical protein CRV05_10815 [Halarcobacter bivalviorum]
MDILSLFFIFVAIELFETNWQKSDTLHGILANNYKVYRYNIFLFFLLNFSFIYSIFLVIYLQNNSFWMLSIVGIKFLDIAFKLNIMSKIAANTELDEIMPNIKIGLLFRYANVLIYPITFLIATNYFNL